MKISTKTGDKGESGLFNGRRLKKNSPVFQLLGEIDELQSFLGFCKCAATADVSMKDILETIQEDLYKMMGLIGNEGEAFKNFTAENVIFLEKNIEKLEKEIGDIRKFVLPGKSDLQARLHLARAVCRRAERRAVDYKESLEDGANYLEEVLKYLNRLSDLLFLMGEK